MKGITVPQRDYLESCVAEYSLEVSAVELAFMTGYMMHEHEHLSFTECLYIVLYRVLERQGRIQKGESIRDVLAREAEASDSVRVPETAASAAAG